MNLSQFLARRLVWMVFVLFFFSIFFFSLVRLIPGDPVLFALSEFPTQEGIEKLRHEMGLDQPFYVQYYMWVRDLLLNGKVGMSIMSWRDASFDILRYFPATFELVTISVAFAFMLGLPIGVISALKKNKWTDHLARVVTISGISTPNFFMAITLQVVLGYWFNLVPVSGRIEYFVTPPSHYTGLYLIDSLLSLNYPAFVSSLRCLLLPAMALAFGPLAVTVRMVRATMLEEVSRDWNIAMVANGLPQRVVQYKYMLRGAISPALTSLALSYIWLLGNAFVIETIFSWPGIAQYGYYAAWNKDLNALMGTCMLLCAYYLIVNFGLELSHAYVDPRLRD